MRTLGQNWGCNLEKIKRFVFLDLICSYIDGLLLGFVKIEVWGGLVRKVPCLFAHVVGIVIQSTCWVLLLVLHVLCIVDIILG